MATWDYGFGNWMTAVYNCNNYKQVLSVSKQIDVLVI